MDQAVENAISLSKDRVEFWPNLLNNLDCKSFCEVGIWSGEFSEVLLSNIKKIEKYILIDPWRSLPAWNTPSNVSDIKFEKIRDEAMARTAPFKSKVVEIRDTTKNAKNKIENASLDFVYIDGDHTLRGITIDLHSMLPKVKAGGLIGGDDLISTVSDYSNTTQSPLEVFPYVMHFAEANDLKIYMLPFKQFLIVNNAEGFEVRDYANYTNLTPRQIYLPCPHVSLFLNFVHVLKHVLKKKLKLPLN